MGMDSTEIGVTMGFNGTKVTDGLKKVTADTGALGKEMNQTAEAVGKLGLQAGVFALFGTAIKEVFDYSKNLTGELNSNERAARDAAQAASSMFADVKDGALRVGANMVGVANSFGEFIGNASVQAFEFWGIMSEGAMKNLEESERINEQERLRGEYMAKNGAAFKAISADLKKTAEESAAMDRAALSAGERRTVIEQELADIKRKIADGDLTTLERRKLESEEARKMLELKKEELKVSDEQRKGSEAAAKILKEANAAAEKAAKEKAQTDKDAYDIGLEFYKLEKELREQVEARAKASKDAVKSEAELVNQAALARIEKEENLTAEDKISVMIDGQVITYKEILDAKESGTKLTDKQIIAERSITEELTRQAQIEKSRHGSFGETGSASSLSDYELDDRLSRETSRLQKIEQELGQGNDSAYFARHAQISVLNGLKAEKEAREEAAEIAKKSAEYDAEHDLGTQSQTRALLDQLSTLKEINGVKQQSVEIDTRAVIAADNILNRAQGSLDAIKESLAQRTQEAPIVQQIAQSAQQEAEAVQVTAQATSEAVVSYSKLTEIGAQYKPVAEQIKTFEIVKTTEIKTQNSLLEDQATRIKSYALSQAQKELDLEKQITEEMQSRHAAAVKAQSDENRVKALYDAAALTDRTSAYKQYSGLAGSIESDLRNAAFQIENGSDPSGYYSGKLQAAGGLIQGKIAEATNAGTAYGFNSSEIVAQLQQLNTRLSANGLKIDGNT